MQFLVLAFDGTDPEALSRRLAQREKHIALIDALKAEGHFLHGGAILNDSGDMIGSVLVCAFPDREALDEWLAQEPYVIGKVWERIEVMPYRVGPSFVSEAV